MQPLYYQIGGTTCWGTSIINDIMYLREGERIKSFQYKTLYAALNSILRREGVWYYENTDMRNYEDVIDVSKFSFSLNFRYVRGREVADEIHRLDFDGKVAICDVGNGDHSILLNGKSTCGNWLFAFDPWWYGDDQSRKEKVKENDNVELVNETAVNVRIMLNHLLDSSECTETVIT